MGEIIRKYLRTVLLVVGVACMCMAAYRAFENAGGEKAYNNAEEIAFSQNQTQNQDQNHDYTVLPGPTYPHTEYIQAKWVPAPVLEKDEHIEKLKQIDLKALQQVNPDVQGWILVPYTEINYPIMQGEDNDFYLRHTWERVENPMGSIFLEYRNDNDFTDFNTIVYGHNMNNGSMFADLSEYSSAWFMERNPYVYIATMDGVFRYQVFSYYKAEVGSFVYGLSFNQRETREDFIKAALEHSYVDLGLVPAYTDRILTLSTCSGNTRTSRWVVLARLEMILSESW